MGFFRRALASMMDGYVKSGKISLCDPSSETPKNNLTGKEDDAGNLRWAADTAYLKHADDQAGLAFVPAHLPVLCMIS